MGISWPQRGSNRGSDDRRVLVLPAGRGGKTTIVRRSTSCRQGQRWLSGADGPGRQTLERIDWPRLVPSTACSNSIQGSEDSGEIVGTRSGDLLVVDEASMVDIIRDQLLRAVPAWCARRFCRRRGSTSQCRAGDGSGDLINANVVRVVRLTHISASRHATSSVPPTRSMQDTQLRRMRPATFFLEADNPGPSLKDRGHDQGRIPARFGLDPFHDVQILADEQVRTRGNALNLKLQEVLNPPDSGKKEIERFGRKFRVGDKVIREEQLSEGRFQRRHWPRGRYRHGRSGTRSISTGESSATISTSWMNWVWRLPVRSTKAGSEYPP